jgi:predicted small lipoprotein YifL
MPHERRSTGFSAPRALFTAFCLPLTILSMRALFLLIVSALLVAACGYKGPLTLPKPKPEAQKPAAPATPKKEEAKPDA